MQQPVDSLLSSDRDAAAESLSAMMQKEQTVYKSRDYLRPSLADEDTIITADDRLKIVVWCYDVVDKCEFDRGVVALTMEMVDRFLSIPSSIAREALHDHKEYQLVAIAALYLAIKTNESVCLDSRFFATMSHGLYSVAEIEEMELNMLHGLSWHIYAPTTIKVAHDILSSMLPREDMQEEESTSAFVLNIFNNVQYQAELAVTDYYFALQRPSTIAAAAIFNSVDQLFLKRQDRLALRHALLSVMLKHKFASIELILAAKRRLECLVDGAANEDTVVSKSPVHVANL